MHSELIRPARFLCVYICMSVHMFSIVTYQLSVSSANFPGSWHMENSGRNAKDEYNQQRIDGAAFVDIDELSDQNSSIPHMLPSERQFSQHIGKVNVDAFRTDTFLCISGALLTSHNTLLANPRICN